MEDFLPTEPIGSIPRPPKLVEALVSPRPDPALLERLMEEAVIDTIRRFEETGSPVITDGEQRKPSFATYPLHGLKNLSPEGVVIPFRDGHTRRLPLLASGPFRFASYAADTFRLAKSHTRLPLKQAVISASALSLLYPSQGIAGYPKEEFLQDLVQESVKDIRSCLAEGASSVQIDFTEARLSLKLDPSKGLLKTFLQLNNEVLSHFSPAERKRIGVHTCPGGDQCSTHSADVPYTELLPELLQLDAGEFFIQLSSESDWQAALQAVRPFASGKNRIFIGVTDPLSSRIETSQEIEERILAATAILPAHKLGTTDDCGFAPFCDDASKSRDLAFTKIKARVDGTNRARKRLSS